MRAIAIPLLFGLCACHAAEPLEPEFRDDTHLVLKRSGCQDACPSYEVHIGPGGNAIFVGHDFTGKHPYRNDDGDLVREYALAYPQRRAMFDLIFSQAYAGLDPVYSAGVSGGLRTVLTLTDRNGTRSITRDAAACLRDRDRPGALPALSPDGKPPRWVPDVFCQTVELIEEASCAGYWSAETRPPSDPNDPRLSPPKRCVPLQASEVR